MNILLICAAGMSTSLLVADMKKYAESDTTIEAKPVSELKNCINNFDVVLVGPQLRYKFKEIEQIVKSNGKSVSLIDPVSYGRIDGKAVYDAAKKLYKQNSKG